MTELTNRVRAEVEELHQFFEDWFTARLAQQRDVFARFTDATASDFHLISPSGVMISGAQASDWIWGIHGQRPDARLWVDKVDVVATRANVVIATYEEWQRNPREETVRISTAVFEHDADAPNGLAWVHVHETWLAQD